ncbi:MAG: ThuA domain-containing protein [Planctomycetota bacterium]
MSSRFYWLCVIVLTWCFSQTALPCADAQQQTQSLDLPRKPLLHLDAVHLARVLGQSDVGEQSVTIWPDAQSPLLRFVAQGPEHAPKLIVGENWATVRFDGIDDALRLYTPSVSLGSASLWMVLAPHSNPGDFRGFFATNAPGQRDYVSGINIDMGPGPSMRWDTTNVEGRGFSGMQNLNPNGVKFGTLQILEVRMDREQKQVVLLVNGKQTGQRPWSGESISLDQWTLGARFYTNGPGDQQVRGHSACDIAELIIFEECLSSEQSQEMYKRLEAKHRKLAELLPEQIRNMKDSDVLVKIENPPELQMLQSGFDVHRIPLELTNVNNVLYRHDGVLVTLGYDGDVHLLRDTNADGLEDQAMVFYKNQGSLRGPIGMVLTKPDDPRGFGVFVSSKGKVSLLLDRDKDDRCDDEIVVAKGWEEIAQNVDAVGLAMAPDGTLYFGLGAANYANAYLVDDKGSSKFDLKSDRGTIQKVSPDFTKRETVCTGVRFPIGIAFGPDGELFCTDQEGATWLANGNPFDELLHIQQGKHYGFPPRHPQFNPSVIDQPSLFDYGPQHQSTCGLFFNPLGDSELGGTSKRFGPRTWGGNALVAGESRGKIWRTQIVKSNHGYIAQSQLIACLQKLTVDTCVSPDGDLVVACHSGPPDWGTGPAGLGSLYKVRALVGKTPRPAMAWRSSPSEITIAFDQPLDPTRWKDLAKKIRIETGMYVRAGDRYENLIPPYAVVQSQLVASRKLLPVMSIGLSPDLRTLTIGFPQVSELQHVAVSLPSSEDPNELSGSIIGDQASRMMQVQETEIDAAPFGVAVQWIPQGSESPSWSGWLPHIDLAVSKSLTIGSAEHDRLWELIREPGKLLLNTQLDLRGIYRPKIQPGAKIDYQWPEEIVTLKLGAQGHEPNEKLNLSVDKFVAENNLVLDIDRQDPAPELPFQFASVEGTGPVTPLSVTLEKPRGDVDLDISVSTQEFAQESPLALSRFLMPWVTQQPDKDKDVVEIAKVPELEGGNWGSGRRLFMSDLVGCSKCHTEPGSGLDPKLGPDLSNMPSRDYASNLRDILQPSHAINPEFIGHQVRLLDGTVLTGVLREQGGKLILGDAQGRLQEVLRSDIEQMVPSKLSIMPTGLLDKLDKTQIRDLMTYLMKPPPSMPLSGPIAAPSLRTAAQVAKVLEGSKKLEGELRRMKVVLVAGPKDHGPAEHDYPAWLLQWGQLLTAARELDVQVAWEFPTQEQLADADVLMFFQKGSWDQERADAMDAFFARGGGAIYLHWAVNGSDRVEDFSKRIGLASWGGKISFRHGPLDLQITDREHPIMRNVPDLDLLDESYWKLTGDVGRIGLLATSNEDGQATPQMWTYEPGGGRVFVSIPGHYSWTFDDPIFRIVVLRGLAWVAREPIDRFNELVPLGARMKR